MAIKNFCRAKWSVHELKNGRVCLHEPRSKLLASLCHQEGQLGNESSPRDLGDEPVPPGTISPCGQSPEPPEDNQPDPDAPKGWSTTLQRVAIILAQQCPWILTAVAMLLHR